MESGAKGCEVIVTGKLRAARAKAMKFKDGYMISSGQPVNEFIDSAVRHVLLRQGCLGIKVLPSSQHIVLLISIQSYVPLQPSSQHLGLNNASLVQTKINHQAVLTAAHDQTSCRGREDLTYEEYWRAGQDHEAT